MHALTLLLSAPAWPMQHALLRRATPLPAPSGAVAAYCAALGIARQQDWPAAPVLAHAAGLPAHQGYWLRLEPVHIDIGVQGPCLHPVTDLDAAHAEALQAIFLRNTPGRPKCFSPPRGGWAGHGPALGALSTNTPGRPKCFSPPRGGWAGHGPALGALSTNTPGRPKGFSPPCGEWAGLHVHPAGGGVLYVQCATPPQLVTTPLDEVAGRAPTRFLPQGADAASWQRLLHEMQMALHEHPINLARQAAGQAPVNSYWPWGGGVWPSLDATPERLWCRASVLADLAHGLGIATRAPPANARSLLEDGARSRKRCAAPRFLVTPTGVGSDVFPEPGARQTAICLLDTADLPDVASPAAAWAAWERAWCQPLLHALRWRRLKELRLVLTGAEPCAARLRPLDLWLPRRRKT